MKFAGCWFKVENILITIVVSHYIRNKQLKVKILDNKKKGLQKIISVINCTVNVELDFDKNNRSKLA